VPTMPPGPAVSDNPGVGLRRLQVVCQRWLPAKKRRCPVVNLECARCAGSEGRGGMTCGCYQHVNNRKRMSRRWSGESDGLKRYVSAISWGFAKN
jgi:hypothetical protein